MSAGPMEAGGLGMAVSVREGSPLARLRRHVRSAGVWIELVRNLAVRDVETRYKHSVLGLYWAIVNPLLSSFIYSFVFGTLLHSGATEGQSYVVFILTGFTFWNLFATGLGSATVSVSGSAALLAKLYFPRVVLPTAAVLARLIDFLFSLGVLAVFVLGYRVPVHWTVFWLAPLLLLELVFALGMGLLLSAVNVLYRDITQILTLVLMVWIWVAPVMISPSGHSAWIRAVFMLDPMGGIIQAERVMIYTGHLTAPASLWSAVAWAGFVLLAGLTVFKRIEPLFAEVL